MTNATSVSELVALWQEQRDQGRIVTAEALAGGCPELIDELNRQIAALAAMEHFLEATAADTPGVAPGATPDSAGLAAKVVAAPLDKDARAPAVAATLVGTRYRPLRLHAHGGLGEVYLARDEELSRDVALKRMRRPGTRDAGSRSRFVREGEITGGLEHPGVVPVYGLTRDTNGEPCYAMRFIRGQTLQEAIGRFHVAAGANRGLALRQLLTRFVAVCNTIAYAHSRGVVHRDLKPANIMLGDYGETLVVDWGLAKQMGGDGERQLPADGLPLASADGHDDGTAIGDVLGTPAFMSPEQAAGDHHAVGPASDIYGLGATLYALLTGAPPFAGDSVGAVLLKVECGEFAPPRQLRPDTPRALEAICVKAMSLEPNARYATALELAGDLERWLADEPVQAYREPWLPRLARWGRRHRPLVAGAGALIVTALVLGGIGGWWLDRQHAERRRGIEGALAEVGRLQRQAKWTEAHAVLKQAHDQLGPSGPVDLRRQLDVAGADLAMVVRLDELRLERGSWIAADDFSPAREAEYVDAFRKAFRDRGLVVDGDADLLLDKIRGSAIKAELVAALDEWAWFTPIHEEQVRLLAIVREADSHPWRDRFRDPVLRKDGNALKQLAAEAPLSELSPFTLATFAAALGRTGGDQEALLRQAQQTYPGDFWINFDLAFVLSTSRSKGEAGRMALEEANGFSRAALAIRPQSSLAWVYLGNIRGKQGKLVEAEAAARTAIRLQGDNTLAHLDLSVYLNRQGRYADAKAVCEDFIRRVRSDYHRIYLNLSVACENLGDLNGAKAACDKAISIQSSYARSWSRRGTILYMQENYAEAERDFREAFRLNPESTEDLLSIVDSLRRQRKLVEAEVFCRELMRTRPKHAPVYLALAGVRSDQGKPADAEAECQKAIGFWPDYAEAHSGLGVVLLQQQKLSEALAAHRKAVSLAPGDCQVLVNYAAALREHGAFEEAEVNCGQAIKIRPQSADAYFQLGLAQLSHAMVGPAQHRREKLHAAAASFRKAVALEPNNGRYHVRLGDALKLNGDFVAALRAYRRGDELGRTAPFWNSYINARIPEAEQLVAIEAQLACDPKQQAESSKRPAPQSVAQLYLFKRHYAAATRFYAQAFGAEPHLALELRSTHRYDAACCAILASCGQGEDAAKLTEKQRADLRAQALAWLRADLRQLADAPRQDRLRVQQTLKHWRRDSDLADVRDEKALSVLPDSERVAWQQFWANVDALLQRAGGEK